MLGLSALPPGWEDEKRWAWADTVKLGEADIRVKLPIFTILSTFMQILKFP